ncbi:hypothetical protein N2152v2_006815 [Parachlorella kessleri]
MTVQLRGGGRHQAALQTAYDLLERQILPLSVPGQAGGGGCIDLGYKQVFTYRSGPWQAGVLSTQQHSVLQKRWSLPLLQAFRYSPAAAAVGAAAGQASRGTAAVGLPAEGPCAAHVDRSLLTLVYAPGQAGLQVKDVYGEWQAVDPLGEDQVLLMPGHTLEYSLCGLLPAAQHRVPSSGQPLLLGAALTRNAAAAEAWQEAAGTVALAARSGVVGTLVAGGVLKAEEDQADASGAPGSAGVPSQQAGEGHTAPCDDHEGVAADDLIELTFLTVMPDVTDTLTVSRFATIASIVLAYHDETGIPPEQVRLIHAGRHLERDRTAADYGLESGDALHVVPRMSGD